jgi:hypothetical protein
MNRKSDLGEARNVHTILLENSRRNDLVRTREAEIKGKR